MWGVATNPAHPSKPSSLIVRRDAIAASQGRAQDVDRHSSRHRLDAIPTEINCEDFTLPRGNLVSGAGRKNAYRTSRSGHVGLLPRRRTNMAGYTTSRWAGVPVRETTAGLIRLDVRCLARQGYLSASPGTTTTNAVSWPSSSGAIDWIQVSISGDDPNAVTLAYRTRVAHQDWNDVLERVPLDQTACALGGTRPWFLCPGCGARRAILFSVGGIFRCRACHYLAFESTRERAEDRARRRAEKLMKRLNRPDGLPGKPPRMHWRTYRRLRRELDQAEGEAFDKVLAWLDVQRRRHERAACC